MTLRIGGMLLTLCALAGCGGSGSDTTLTSPPALAAQPNRPPPANPNPPPPQNPPPAAQPPAQNPPPPAANGSLDQQLRGIIGQQGLTGDPSTGRNLPALDSPLAQLGMRLFFSKTLGGEFAVACASCHHPDLAGTDRLSMPVGVGAVDADLLGPGRNRPDDLPNVPRNAPTTFNVAMWDRFLFDDGRIESLAPHRGANGAAGPIRTPDSPFGSADPAAGPNLPAAQSRFPVTSTTEMRDGFLPNQGDDAVRDGLAARFRTNQWLPLFQAAYGAGDAQTLITYSHIAEAIAAYERSQVLVDTPWRDYVAGNNAAISDAAKRGAIVFLLPANNGGAGCSGCHRGDFFTDESFHTIAIPQIGPGKGDGTTADDDFGRARESGDANDKYQFRTPTLLNVAITAPYDHDGAFATLTDVIRHYRNPQDAAGYVVNHRWCDLPQFASLPRAQCEALYPDAGANTQAALAKLQADRQARRRALPPINISDAQIADIVAFLQTLTDRCAVDTTCVHRWVPPRDGGPDQHQLDAVNENGDPL